MNVVHVIQTDFGVFPCPQEIIDLQAKALRRKNGRIDRRTKAGKLFYQKERMFILEKVQEGFDAWKASRA